MYRRFGNGRTETLDWISYWIQRIIYPCICTTAMYRHHGSLDGLDYLLDLSRCLLLVYPAPFSGLIDIWKPWTGFTT